MAKFTVGDGLAKFTFHRAFTWAGVHDDEVTAYPHLLADYLFTQSTAPLPPKYFLQNYQQRLRPYLPI
jgi:hypothetical protein